MNEPPHGYQYGPVYRPSLLSALRAVAYIARGTPRSLAHDALYAVADMPAPPLIRGLDYVPERGPLILAANHYERPGLWMAWPALLISSALAARAGRDIHWVAIQEWQAFSPFGVPIPPAATRAVFERAFAVYGIVAMPPRYARPSERAEAVRVAIRLVRGGGIIGLMPEGTVGAMPELLPAMPGSGTFLAHLARGAPVLPTGIYEEDGRLTIAFGEPFALPPGPPGRDEDEALRDLVMRAIRDLLPEALWGAYR